MLFSQPPRRCDTTSGRTPAHPQPQLGCFSEAHRSQHAGSQRVVWAQTLRKSSPWLITSRGQKSDSGSPNTLPVAPMSILQPVYSIPRPALPDTGGFQSPPKGIPWPQTHKEMGALSEGRSPHSAPIQQGAGFEEPQHARGHVSLGLSDPQRATLRMISQLL